MDLKPACPCCNRRNWETISSKTFHRHAQAEDEFRALRMRVLFEIWAHGHDEIRIFVQLCRSCGFVGFHPRPTSTEIDDKYRFLTRVAPKPAQSPCVSSLDRRRSADLFCFAGGRTAGPVLDFGGGTGALLCRFAAEGLDCGVVDHVRETVPHIARLGSSLDELHPEQRFGTIIASHVFEHLADPTNTARVLRSHLAPAGILIVEVPLEILGGPPQLKEPVTHVNFFCPSSLEVALRRAGLDIVKCRVCAVESEHGNVCYAVRALARRAETEDVSMLPGDAEARRLLAAKDAQRLRLALKNPKNGPSIGGEIQPPTEVSLLDSCLNRHSKFLPITIRSRTIIVDAS